MDWRANLDTNVEVQRDYKKKHFQKKEDELRVALYKWVSFGVEGENTNRAIFGKRNQPDEEHKWAHLNTHTDQ